MDEITLNRKTIEGEMEFELNASMKDGKFQSEIRAKHPGFVEWVDNVATYFRDSGGDNFVTVDAFHPDLGMLSIIIQRTGKKTPAMRIAELEAEVSELKAGRDA